MIYYDIPYELRRAVNDVWSAKAYAEGFEPKSSRSHPHAPKRLKEEAVREFEMFARFARKPFDERGAEVTSREMLCVTYVGCVRGLQYAQGRVVLNADKIFEATRSELERMAEEITA